jgi:hypothetical protein
MTSPQPIAMRAAPPAPRIIQQRYDDAMQRQIQRIAALAVVSVVECEGLSIDDPTGTSYDMRPAIDTNHFADEEVELVRDHVNLGLDAGWLQSVPGGSRYVVQVVWQDVIAPVTAQGGAA